MKRIVAAQVLAFGGIVLVGCEGPVAPSGRGGVSLDIVVVGRSAALDSGHVVVRGPTNVTVRATPGTNVTITSLVPGTYTVALEGFAGGVVDHFGQTSGVTVVAGQNTPANVTFATFTTSVNPLPDSVIGRQFTVSYSAVPGAASYLIEWSKDSSFASGAATVSATVDSERITVSDFAQYFIRVRPVDPYQGLGLPSPEWAIRTAVLTFSALSAGAYHTCGVQAGIAGYCWGDNSSGALGDGTNIGRLNPVVVAGGLAFSDMSAGDSASCGVVTGGAAYCWGNNQDGGLGDGTFTAHVSPVPVVGGLTFTTVSTKLYHTCGVTTGGAAYCWGNNVDGEVGAGDTMSTHAGPVPVSGGLTFSSIRAGGFHSCGKTTSGAAYCWGYNGLGALGEGDTIRHVSPALVNGGLTFAAVSAGLFHTCGITTGGAAYCWGDNINSELGVGDTTNRTSPALVSGGLVFATISAGYYHTCGVTTGGSAYCWGYNGYGELGDGTTGNERKSPVAVAGGLMFATVTAGRYHTCGVTTGGIAYCWGNNPDGRLGTGTATFSAVPVPVVE